jgi:selenocysteine-specific elongation factor
MVQLFAEVPVAVPAGEPFIIRTLSPAATIGGGRILDPVSRRHRRHDEGVLARLRVLAGAAPAEILADRLRAAGTRGYAMAELTRLLVMSLDRLRGYLEDAGAIVLPDGTVLDGTAARELECEVLALVEKHHRDHPTEPGLPRDRLGRNAGAMAAALIARCKLRNEQGRLRHRDFDPAALLPERDRRLIAAVEREFLSGGLMPPDASAVVGNDRERFQAIRYLTRTGVLVRAEDRVQKREILFHRDALAKAQRIMTIHLADRSGGFLVGDLGRLLGISRKYSIPLLEHMDAIRFTRRLDDRRVISETVGQTSGT